MIRRAIKRVCLGAVLAALVTAFAGLFTGWTLLRASLPRTSGAAAVPGLAGPVTIQRDAIGIPMISGGSFADVAAALGFVHAQDRFFQMDVLRRISAGELAALFGPAAAPSDRVNRAYRFRRVATLTFDRLPLEHRRWLEAYTRGVNAGLADLGARPPEYFALGAQPVEWRPEDCMLVNFTMYLILSQAAGDELMEDAMRSALPGELVDFLTPETTRFDAPLIGPPGNPLGPAPIPARDAPVPRAGASHSDERPPAGSNGWAVAASRTRDGRAILASDMHLPLSTPNIWYRAQLQWGAAPQSAPPAHRLVGVTLPGVPALVVGSNGDVAWGFTNVTGDFEDYVVVEVEPADSSSYRTPEGIERFGSLVEEIEINGAPPERVELRTTRWGVVAQHDAQGRPLALQWPALRPEINNLALLDMPATHSVEDALAVAQRWHGPPQNVMLADSHGRVAWTISGWIPRRMGFTGRVPVPWGAGVGWDGERAERPQLVDPADGVVFSANQRPVPLEESRPIGYGWAAGIRAGRIAELLRASREHTEASMLAIQLDTVTPSMEFFRRLTLDSIPADDPDLGVARAVVDAWNGRADVDQPALRILVRFRAALQRRVIDPLFDPVAAKVRGFRYAWFQSDEPLMRLLEERPAHYLAEGEADWPSLIRDAFSEASKLPPGAADWSSPHASWGDFNRAVVSHYLSRAAPWLGRFLDMPRLPLPGHPAAVRAQSRTFGASERMVVSPGHEEDGILHMPTGQSGHPLSPHYADSHQAWVTGAPTPLLAGPPQSEFTLTPSP